MESQSRTDQRKVGQSVVSRRGAKVDSVECPADQQVRGVIESQVLIAEPEAPPVRSAVRAEVNFKRLQVAVGVVEQGRAGINPLALGRLIIADGRGG